MKKRLTSPKNRHFEWALLNKTEIWIDDLIIHQVDLNQVSKTIAHCLQLHADEVLVVDVRDKTMVIDILRRSVRPEQIAGKERKLLRALSGVKGLTLTPDTAIHSEGVLGMISLDPETAQKVIEKAKYIAIEVREKVGKRAVIFATGTEVKSGQIVDTNTPWIIKRLEEEGFDAAAGGILEDNDFFIASKIQEAASEGYGIIITTGGVGAEEKDQTIEGIKRLDPEAFVHYIVRYKKGTGRHAKDGVRIAVGYYSPAYLIALPGPNKEVRHALETLIEIVKAGTWDKELLATQIALRLRDILVSKMSYRH
jgi:molybdenum cofactor synthesis domain-containing protein